MDLSSFHSFTHSLTRLSFFKLGVSHISQRTLSFISTIFRFNTTPSSLLYSQRCLFLSHSPHPTFSISARAMGLKRSRARDYDEIKTTEDILHRWSRPQRNSTFVPNRRDWRYETGVYQRKDFDGSSGDKTIWDMLDEDCVSGVFGRERRRTHRGNSSMEGAGETSRHRAYEPSAVGVGMRLPKVLDTSRELSVKLYGRAANGVRSDVEEDWDQAGPIPPLQLLSTNSSIEPVLTRHTSPLSLSSVLGPPVAISRPSTTTHLNHGTEALPPFHRKWKDNTRHFCMKNVRNLLRNPEKPVDPIPVSLQWWDSAVSVDAILPPGIAISAKELNVSST